MEEPRSTRPQDGTRWEGARGATWPIQTMKHPAAITREEAPPPAAARWTPGPLWSVKSKRTATVRFCPYKVSLESDRRQKAGGGGVGSCRFVGAEMEFGGRQEFWRWMGGCCAPSATELGHLQMLQMANFVSYCFIFFKEEQRKLSRNP